MKKRVFRLVALVVGIGGVFQVQATVFSDGFESGGTCSWSFTVPLMFFYQDSDNDNFGDLNVFVEGCEAPLGHVSNGGDCDDTSDVTFPGAGLNDSPVLCMKDFDGDDYGDDDAGPFEPGSDCDDEVAAINPGADDVCDDVDNDCSGTADQDFLPGGSVTYDGGPYPGDAGLAKGDGCGTGDCASGTVICDLGGLSLTCSTLDAIQPETCDGADNDCDGSIDEEGDNACGGCATLPVDPGGPCGTCGVYECLDVDNVHCVDPCTLVEFGPVPSFILEGATGETVPEPLEVTLAGLAPDDLFVTVTSGDPSVLAVIGGGCTVLEGSKSAVVELFGQALGSASLTASHAGVDLDADVRVYNDFEPRQVVEVTPEEIWIQTDASDVMVVWLDIPAGFGGQTVDLSLDPGVYGSVPPAVGVIPNDLSAVFSFIAGPVAGVEVLTASIGPSSASATVTVFEGKVLVVNRVGSDEGGIETGGSVERSGAAPSVKPKPDPIPLRSQSR